MEIRLLTADDSKEFWNIRLRALSGEKAAFSASYEEEVKKPIEDIIERFHEEWSTQDNYILGAFKEGILIGIVGFRRERRMKLRHKGEIWGMYIIPDSRGEGTGKLLLTEVLRRSHNSQGLEQILLAVTSDNKSAKSLYVNYGFTRYGIEEKAIKFGNSYFDSDLMVLLMENG